MSRILLFSCLVLSIGIMSCRKKPLPTPANPVTNNPLPTKGTINIKINNVVGARPLSFGSLATYTLPNGDEFTVSKFNYYLSNFVFTDDNGKRFAEQESYHLAMAETPESLNFTIKDVPYGKYKSVEFLIGVDSVRNFSGAQYGALDPKYGMLWSWSTGYIMAKMEGFSPQSSIVGNQISYHIAGFKGFYSVIQKVTLELPQAAQVADKKSPVLNVNADLLTWFQAPNFSSFNEMPSIGDEGIKAYGMSMNYKGMFSIRSVENQ